MKAIIFDLFDTLLFISEEINPYLKAYEKHFSKVMSYPTFRREAISKDHDSLFAFGKENGLNIADLKELDLAIEKEVDSIKPFDEVEAVLDHLSKRFDLFVLSNIATPYIPAFQKVGLDQWIKQAYFSSKIGHIKPDSAIFEYVVNEIGFKKNEILLVGDSYQADYQGARDCGIRSIWLDREGAGHPDTITNLKELLKLKMII